MWLAALLSFLINLLRVSSRVSSVSPPMDALRAVSGIANMIRRRQVRCHQAWQGRRCMLRRCTHNTTPWLAQWEGSNSNNNSGPIRTQTALVLLPAIHFLAYLQTPTTCLVITG